MQVLSTTNFSAYARPLQFAQQQNQSPANKPFLVRERPTDFSDNQAYWTQTPLPWFAPPVKLPDTIEISEKAAALVPQLLTAQDQSSPATRDLAILARISSGDDTKDIPKVVTRYDTLLSLPRGQAALLRDPENGNMAVGTSFLWPSNLQPVGILTNSTVHPDYKNLGISSRTLKLNEAFARQNGYRFLLGFSMSPFDIAFMKAHGYQTVGPDGKYFPDGEYTTWVVKDLTGATLSSNDVKKFRLFYPARDLLKDARPPVNLPPFWNIHLPLWLLQGLDKAAQLWRKWSASITPEPTGVNTVDYPTISPTPAEAPEKPKT